MDNCPFCNLSDNVEILCETERCVVFLDGYPVSEGHTLIIPKRHVESFFSLTYAEREEIGQLVRLCKKILDEKYQPNGYNIGVNVGKAAGQSVMHCHVHLIPRYDGDVENPRGGVRGVIPSKQNY